MPEVRVQVLYDFEYTTKEGREIWMKEGERLYLIQKTNDDWWQVLRNSERRPFYVPAAYVEEVQPKKTKTSFRSTRLNEVRLEPKALTKNYRARDDRYDELGAAPYGKRLSEEEDPIYDNECFLVSLSQGDITCRGMKEKKTPQFRREHLAENWEHRSEKSRRAEGHSIETLDHRPPRQVSSATGKKERAVRRVGEAYGRRSDGLMGNSTARLDDGTKDGAEQRQNKPLPLIFHNLAYEGDFEDAEEMKENDSEHQEDISEDLDEVSAKFMDIFCIAWFACTLMTSVGKYIYLPTLIKFRRRFFCGDGAAASKRANGSLFFFLC
ncbi:hypothetical protein J437_LFUL000807 [Ladona fulva]|uniref:SH3 domain-containing protein n=1 Tax=Ladona fulva TaxID=123851 RepID=A0A8K0KSC4_LADFU|nr:hypothetical protein J437_LFUL000807 [Ladona fulva]